ncbi:hypothetical protein E2320_017494, partial [Naja naja]
LQILHLYGC